MTDWKEHDGGPQPVAGDVWVAIRYKYDGPANLTSWVGRREYRIINQHLIDAARLEGIRLGLEAAARGANEWQMQIRPCDRFVDDAIRRLDPAAIANGASREP